MRRKKSIYWTIASSQETFIDLDKVANCEDPFDTTIKDISKKLKNKRCNSELNI